MDWMLMPYKRYADFSGRSQRMEYWMFSLFMFLVIIALVIVAAVLGGLGDSGGSPSMLFIIPFILFVLVSIVPSIAVTVRRLHDQDKSGWFYLLSFIPYVGGIIIFVLMCIDGTRGPNRFGPDPKGGSGDIFG
ncbi:MAG: DUF805 domain-containing protein [Alphaproteobacteria bacterium HGW-Alphaproteobacteria-13]|jgi:uncharacterized membrane protein YhaH (DUF805 family)|nr:MAG: DUF805 domain-containing protein [Alphaproteobacteria bacterium HGW-Alphaproteobacteria-13]